MGEVREAEEVLALQPRGRLGVNDAGELLKLISESTGAVELDFSEAEMLDISMLQLVLVAVASLKKRDRGLAVQDSAAGVLRAALDLAGIRAELAGLSARLVL